MRRGVVGAVVALVAGAGVAALTGGAQAASGCLLPILCPTTSTTTSTATFPFPFPPTPAPQPAPPAADAGATYYGRADNERYIASVGVTKDGKHVRYGSFGYIAGRCNDGQKYSSGDYVSLRGRTRMSGGAIGPNGSTSYHIVYRGAYSYDKRGRKVYGTERFAVRMRFDGSTATGTLTDRFTSRRLRCASGSVGFTVWLGGTVQAPLQTADVRTGRYIGRSGYAGDSMTLYVSTPLRLVERAVIRLSWPELVCSGGVHFTRGAMVWDVFTIPLHGGRFSRPGRTHVGGRGYTDDYRTSLSGNLHGSSADAVWKLTVVIRARGRRAVTCETAGPGDQFTLYWK